MSALELAEAAGARDDALVERARLALRDAGDRAFALNAFRAAAGYYGEALELWPADVPDWAEMLFRRAHAIFVLGEQGAASELERARDALIASGEPVRAAEAEAFLAQEAWNRGQQDETFAHLRAAQALIAGAEPSAAVARVHAWSARYRSLTGDRVEGIRIAQDALAIAEDLGLDELRAHALTTIGTAKTVGQDPSGVDELEQAIAIGKAANSPTAASALTNLSVFVDHIDARRGRELQLEALAEAERLGDANSARFVRGNLISGMWMLGEWDDAFAAADAFIAECEKSPHYQESMALEFRGLLYLARGNEEAALRDYERARVLSHAAKDPQTLTLALVRSAYALIHANRVSEAEPLFAEVLPMLANAWSPTWWLAEVALALGKADEVRPLFASAVPTALAKKSLAMLDGDFVRAAEVCAEANYVSFEAEAHLLAAEALLSAGTRAEGEAELEKALAFYRPRGAVLYLRRAEPLAAASA